MTAPHKQIFEHPQAGKMTVIVVDQDEFNENVDSLTGVFNLNEDVRLDAENIKELKKLGNIPCIGRGTKTEFLFEKYDVSTDTMGLIVRGFTRRMLKEAAERN